MSAEYEKVLKMLDDAGEAMSRCDLPMPAALSVAISQRRAGSIQQRSIPWGALAAGVAVVVGGVWLAGEKPPGRVTQPARQVWAGDSALAMMWRFSLGGSIESAVRPADRGLGGWDIEPVQRAGDVPRMQE